MAVIADAAVAGIDAAGRGHPLRHFIGIEWIRKVDALRMRAEFGVELFENLTPHEALETERVAERKRASLPVEEFVHLKDIGVAPAQALAVAGFDQTEILPDRADGQDPARRPVRSVVSRVAHRPWNWPCGQAWKKCRGTVARRFWPAREVQERESQRFPSMPGDRSRLRCGARAGISRPATQS